MTTEVSVTVTSSLLQSNQDGSVSRIPMAWNPAFERPHLLTDKKLESKSFTPLLVTIDTKTNHVMKRMWYPGTRAEFTVTSDCTDEKLLLKDLNELYEWLGYYGKFRLCEGNDWKQVSKLIEKSP